MNWNIFFVTIAQVSATIVAIWGAFIISKTLNNESAYKRKKAEISSVWNISQVLSMKSNMKFKEYNYSKRYDSLIKLKKELSELKKLSADDLYLRLDFSWYDNRHDVLKWLRQIISQDEQEYTKRIEEELKNLNNFDYNANQQEHLGVGLQSQYIKVYDNSNKVYFLFKSVENNPESSKIISVSIIILSLMFCLGVIIPMSLIQISTDNNYAIEKLGSLFTFSSFYKNLFSLKGLIILLITSPFYMLLIYFFCYNLRLKYKPASIEILKEYIEMGAYNIHFKNFDDNGKFFSEREQEAH